MSMLPSIPRFINPFLSMADCFDLWRYAMHSNVPSLDHSLFMVGLNLGHLIMMDRPIVIKAVDPANDLFVTFYSDS